MTEDKLTISLNELEGLLIKTCNCVLIGTAQINLNKYDSYIDKIRPYFVSTLEDKIYTLLERFIYSEDADQFHEQFPCLKKCIDTAKTLRRPITEQCKKYIGTGIVEDAIKGTIKYLIKEGFFTAFINSVVLNNRINRICRELDALDIEKTCLGYLNVWNFVCEKDYWVVNPFQAQIDDPLSDLVVEVGTEDQECIPCKILKRKDSENPNNENNFEICGSSAYKIMRTGSNQEYSTSTASYCRRKLKTEHLRISVSKVQFASCGCVDLVKPKKFGKLKLPCKSEVLIRKIFNIDKSLLHSCLTPIRKKFEEAVYNVCSCLNDVLSRVDSRGMKNLYLICESRPGYVSFKLKSMLGPSYGSKPCLFSARVATCRGAFKNQNSFRKSFSREDQKRIQRGKTSLSEVCRSDYCRHSLLYNAQEKDKEINETDFLCITNVSSELNDSYKPNVSCGADVSCGPGLETVSGSKITFQISNDLKDFNSPKLSCSCGHVSNPSRSSFFKIELKLRNLSECFKRLGLMTQKESVVNKEDKIEGIDCQQQNELEKLQELQESDLQKTSYCPALQQFVQSDETFPDSQKANSALECICSTKNDQKLERNETINFEASSNFHPDPRQIGRTEKSQIPRLICSRKIFTKIDESKPDSVGFNQLNSDLKRETRISTRKEETNKKSRPKLVPCPEREFSPTRSKCGSFSKIPVLMKEKPPVVSNPQQSSPPSSPCKNRLISPIVSRCQQSNSSSSPCRNRLITSPKEKLELRLNCSTSRKRTATPPRQRCFKVSKSNIPKSGHQVDVKASSKTCSNITFTKSSNPSAACLSKVSKSVPKTVKRNLFVCQNPPSRSNSPQKCQEINLEIPKIGQSVCSRTFVKDKLKTSLTDIYKRIPEMTPQTTYVIVTGSEDEIDQCDTKCPCCREFNIIEKVPSTCRRESQEAIQDSETRKDYVISHDSSLDRVIQKLGASPCKVATDCLLKSQIKEIVKPIGIERENRFCNHNLRTVSVQTLEQKMPSKGINIDIREMKETLSKGINVDRREVTTKGVNINLISKDSVISLQTNVTKIISVVDITIFEGDLGKERCKKPLEYILKENIQPRTACPKSNTYQPRTFRNISSKCCSSKEKNSKFHLKSSIYLTSLDLPSRQTFNGIPEIKVKSCEARRHKRTGGIGDSWVNPVRSTKAQNIITAICDPFSHKSINRIKFLIQTKLCKMLLDREKNGGSKSFVSNERYYISASSEKTCCSPGRRIFSSESSRSEDLDFCCKRTARRTENNENRVFKCPIRIGSDWEFGGDEDCFLIRKRYRSSKGRHLRTTKRKELRKTLKKDLRTSKEDARTFKEKLQERNKKQPSDWNVGCLDYSECPRQLEANQSVHVRCIRRGEDKSNTSPGEAITFSHLGKRNDKYLRQRDYDTWSYRESDKENGCKVSKRSSLARSFFGKGRCQYPSKNISKVQEKNRFSLEREGVDESFCDLDQNVRSKLREYVTLCKSTKHFLIKGSGDVYGVSSTSIPFSDRRDLRRP